MADTIRWGILGTGWVANQFALGLSQLPEAALVAVGSRTAESSDRFGESFHVPRRHASYEALADDPGVDVIYVATPNPMHRAHSLLCLEAGKPVLCEKPFALNALEAEQVIQVAREEGLFLMEAMWTRFFPLMARLRELLAGGAIGDVRMLVADLCIRFDFDPCDRRYDLALGGGSLLDLGVYPLSFASMIMGRPSGITTQAHLGETGVDEEAGVLLSYDECGVSVLYSSIQVDSPVEALLLGTNGQVRLHPWWIKPDKFTLSTDGQNDRTIEMPFEGNGYQFEALEVMRCLRAGELESRLMPLDETVSILETMDAIRCQWGLRFPSEQMTGAMC